MQRLLQFALLIIALIVGLVLLRSDEVPDSDAVVIENPMEGMLLQIESRISDQEDVKDVRCWSSVNKIQTFLSGMPIELAAIGQRVERYVTLIDEVWLAANDQSDGVEIDAAKLIGVFKSKFPNQVTEHEGDVSFDFGGQFMDLGILKDSIEDYGDTIESWRLLQSWSLRKVSQPAASPDGKEGVPFSKEALNQFRDFLVVYDIALLKLAKEVAQDRKLGEVDVESMNIAFDKLQASLSVTQLKDSDDSN